MQTDLKADMQLSKRFRLRQPYNRLVPPRIYLDKLPSAVQVFLQIPLGYCLVPVAVVKLFDSDTLAESNESWINVTLHPHDTR
jgi:hypothetical protein